MRKGVTAVVVGVGLVFAITIVISAMVVMGYIDVDPYTDVMDCTVVGEATQPAIGEFYSLKLGTRQNAKIQKKQCLNMDDLVVGETFKAVIVYNKEDVIIGIVRLED